MILCYVITHDLHTTTHYHGAPNSKMAKGILIKFATNVVPLKAVPNFYV